MLYLGGAILAQMSQVVLVVKNLPANAGNLRDTGSIPDWGTKIPHATQLGQNNK